MRTIGVVTVGRSDYGSYLPVLRRIQGDPGLRLQLLVAGMHLSPEFGLTVKMIEADGLEISARVDMLLSSDTPEGIAKSMGIGIVGFAQAYARLRPDLLLVLGDRFEMHAAAVAAVPFLIPLAHIGGGELTEGAIDDAFRHSMTKLSHLHFASTSDYAKRLRQMGEEPWRVIISGAPHLDNLQHIRFMGDAELSAQYGLRVNAAPLLVTYHPVTLEYEQAEWQVEELLGALQQAEMPMVFTLPNADTNGRIVMRLIEEFVRRHPAATLVANLGTQGYFSVMRRAMAMVGNSSSGIIEAPSFELPVVNIGSRQRGRRQAENVINTGSRRQEILEGIRRATAPEFRAGLRGMRNPYGDGHAADVIVRSLKEIPLGPPLIRKRFVDSDLSAAELMHAGR